MKTSVRKIVSLSFILCMTLLIAQSQAKNWYVDAASTADSLDPDYGTSWEKAMRGKHLQRCFRDLNTLTDTAAQDSVLIAQGKYVAPQADRYGFYINAILKPLVVKGGYSSHGGNERVWNWKEYRSIFSGEIGDPEISTDNKRTMQVNSMYKLLLDGFIIKDGYTSGSGGGLSVWGGKYCDDNYGITISRCIIEDNYAKAQGGGIWLNGYGFLLDSVIVRNNKAEDQGGGIYLDGSYDDGSLMTKCMMRNTRFSNNEAGIGGAVYYLGGEDNGYDNTEKVVFHQCSLDTNTAYGVGGAIYGSGCNLHIQECSFRGNDGEYAGGAVTFLGDKVYINNSSFYEHGSKEYGGACYIRAKLFECRENEYLNNSVTDKNGGAVYLECDSAKFLFSTFENNESKNSNGGAIGVLAKKIDINGCTFKHNKSLNGAGGALLLYHDVGFGKYYTTGAVLYKNTFTANEAKTGGAIMWLGKGVIESCHFENNEANSGGSIYGWQNVTERIHFRDNHDHGEIGKNVSLEDLQAPNFTLEEADRRAEIDSSSLSTIRNCTFLNNTADTGSVLYGWNGRVVSSVLAKNIANQTATIYGVAERGSPKLQNVTLTDNTAYAGGGGCDNCDSTIVSSIFWNNTQPHVEGDAEVTYSIIDVPGTGNIADDPRFKAAGNYRLSDNSPAINAGDPHTMVDESETDLDGNPRKFGARIDIGAYESQKLTAPVILSTLLTQKVVMGDTLSIKLDSLTQTGGGYYVSYWDGPVGNVTWVLEGVSDSLTCITDFNENLLHIIPSEDTYPGDRFAFTIKAYHSGDITKYDSRTMNVEVISAGFDYRIAEMKQDNTGLITGTIECRRNIAPLQFSQRRLYLFDQTVADRDNMPYIDDVSLLEHRAPASRGGEQEWGIYSFSFNPQQRTVRRASGSSTDKTVAHYMEGADELCLIMPLYTIHDAVREVNKCISVNFERPTTALNVYQNGPKSQIVSWKSYTGSIEALVLQIVELDSNDVNSPGTVVKTIDLSDNLLSTTYTADSLFDSQWYEYRLTATDIHHNVGLTTARGETPSDYYSIRGYVDGKIPDSTHHLEIAIIAADGADSGNVLNTIHPDTTWNYEIPRVTNGEYYLRLSCPEMQVSGMTRRISVWRENISEMDFTIEPAPLMDIDGMRIVQEQGSGDLVFTAWVNNPFETEVPKDVLLKWHGFSPVYRNGEKLFPITDYTVVASNDSGEAWRFRLTRDILEQEIEFLGDSSGFEEQVIYKDAQLITETFAYSPFRTGLWSFPMTHFPDSGEVMTAADSMLSFSPQIFTKPLPPIVTSPIMGDTTGVFTIIRNGLGAGLKANASFIRKDNMSTPIDTVENLYDIANTSESVYLFGNTTTIRYLDYRYAIDNTSTAFGSQIIGGLNVINEKPFVTSKNAHFTDTNSQDASLSWKIHIPEAKRYDLLFHVDYMDEEEPYTRLFNRIGIGTNRDTIWYSIGADTAKYALIVKYDDYDYEDSPGWYAAESIQLGEGEQIVTVFPSEGDVRVDALCLIDPDYYFRNSKQLTLDSISSIPYPYTYGIGNDSLFIDDFRLQTAQPYDLEVYLEDRFGNRSEMITYRDLYTQDNYYSNKVTVDQEPASGDLTFTLNPPESGYGYKVSFDSIAAVGVQFGGQEQWFPVKLPYDTTGPTSFTISSDSLKKHFDSEEFLKEGPLGGTFYVKKMVQVIKDKSFSFKKDRDTWCNDYNGECNVHHLPDYDGTDRKTGCEGFWWWSWKWNCRYEEYDTTDISVMSPFPFFFQWPRFGGDYASAHEYRPVTTPAFDTVSIEPQRIRLSCTNLNTDTAGIKKQMAGTLTMKWIPGSLCEDSTIEVYDFGNRFGMDVNGWVAFEPSFEGAIHSQVGLWKKDLGGAAKHQWLDNDIVNDTLTGGKFYPNIGDSVTVNEITSNPLTDFPSLSMGIELDSAQASADSSAAEQFTLWVLPGAHNGNGNMEFYWGLDTGLIMASPTEPEIGIAEWPQGTPAQWQQGPTVTLMPGRHTIELYMRDDGVSVAGIALHKASTPPTFTASQLNRWGDRGFDLSIIADNLQDSTAIDFSWEIEDRFGNIGESGGFAVTTKQLKDPLPNVVITPDQPLENSFYRSLTPSFTLALEEPFADSAILHAELWYHANGVSTEYAHLQQSRIDSANSWRVAADSANPLNVITGSVCDTNGYELRAYASDTLGNVSRWTQIVFGVLPDSNQVPEVAVIQDSLYAEGTMLVYEYVDGIGLGDGTIRGNLQVLFDSSVTIPGCKLMLEGALIQADTSISAGGDIIYNHITAISGGRFAAYRCDYAEYCESVAEFALKFGKHTVEFQADSLSRRSYGSDMKIVGRAVRIIDDNGSKARASGDRDISDYVPLTKHGVIDTFYTGKDYFFMENVLKFTSSEPGIHIKGCVTTFSRNDYAAPADTFYIGAEGNCNGCGPYINFTVISPVYMDDEFTVSEKLDEPVEIRYTEESQDYEIVWTGDMKNPVSSSSIGWVSYRNWPLRIDSYEFDANGVKLTDFAIKPDATTFPPDVNGSDSTLAGFSNIRIQGQSSVNSGALHFFGTGQLAGASDVRLRTANDYIFTGAEQLHFVPDADHREYTLRMPAGGKLLLPAWKEHVAFREKDTLETDIGAAAENFTLASDGIRELSASGEFFRTIGDPAGRVVDTANGIYGLKIQGTMDVTYAARDFQLDLHAAGDNPLFTLGKHYLQVGLGGSSRDTAVSIPNASIGLFSDLSINTLYGKTMFDTELRACPKELIVGDGGERVISIPANGIDIVHTTDMGVIMLMLDPKVSLDMIENLVDIDEYFEIYNAAITADNSLAAISARIPLPERNGPSFVPEKISDFISQLGSFKLHELYLGYKRVSGKSPAFLLGADATLEFGSLFSNIGMQGEKVHFDRMQLAYCDGCDRKWTLDTLNARAFALPRMFAVGPSELNGSSDNKKYVEFFSGGNGLNVEYGSGSGELSVEMNNWAVRTTNDFPVKQLRGINLHLKEFQYVKDVKDSERGRIKKFEASVGWRPPEGKIQLGDVVLRNVNVTVGTEDEATEIKVQNGDAEEEITLNPNETTSNGYFSITFDTLQIGDQVYDMTCENGESTGAKVYFDGTFYINACLNINKKVAVYPIKVTDPDVYLDGESKPIYIQATYHSEHGFYGTAQDVNIRSINNVPFIGTPLNATVNDIAFTITDGDFDLTRLACTWAVNKRVDNDIVGLTIKEISIGINKEKSAMTVAGVQKTGPLFFMQATPEIDFKLGDRRQPDGNGCSFTAESNVGFVARLEGDREFDFLVDLRSKFDCTVGSLNFGADMIVQRDTIGLTRAFLNLSTLEEWGMVEVDKGGIDARIKQDGNEGAAGERTNWLKDGTSWKAGVLFEDVFWVRNETTNNWDFEKDSIKFIPTFKLEKGFDINVAKVYGTFNFERLFTKPNPGIGIEDIRVELSEDLGGYGFPTGLSLFIDGKKPFIHPSFDGPSVIKLTIPEIGLTDDIKLGEAAMEFGVERKVNPSVTEDGGDEQRVEEKWYFRGMASMNLKGAVDEVTVDVAFEKPDPWECITGIRHAIVTIKLASGCRIPIGTTPFYISGFMGAMYDGEGMPQGAIACGIPHMSPGLKVEAAVFIEFEQPDVVNGRIGFWVHLMRLNFGINGQVVALKGVADVDACAALYNNGRAFHGHFITNAHLGLSLHGDFIIDIWADDEGGNLTGSTEAKIGLSRGSLYKGKWLKIPSKTKWFGGLFTKFGKFDNRKNGFTTGIRIMRKSFGLGVVGGSFKIGNMNKYNLKQAPIVINTNSIGTMSLAKTSMFTSSSTSFQQDYHEYKIMDPEMILEGDEVISLVAASATDIDWPDHALKIGYIVDGDTLLDDLPQNYLPLEGDSYETGIAERSEILNTKTSIWQNTGHDSIVILMPKIDDEEKFEYVVFAGLPEPEPADIRVSYRDTTIDGRQTTMATFNGSVGNWLDGTRILERFAYTDSADTILKQSNDLKLFYSVVKATAHDSLLTKSYAFNRIDIPLSQLIGYDTTMKRLEDFSNVSVRNDSLIIENLRFDCRDAFPGTLAFGTATDLVDYVVWDDRGNVQVVDSLHLANSVRIDAKYALAEGADTIGRFENTFRRPIGPVEQFTATGSPLDTGESWRGYDERRSILLRWRHDEPGDAAGYELSWCPAHMNFNDSAYAKSVRSTVISNGNSYRIHIPELDTSIYTPDSADAAPIAYAVYDTIYHIDNIICSDADCDTIYEMELLYDSTVVTRQARMWGDALDTAYYNADAFDIRIVPLRDSMQVIADSNWRYTGTYREDSVMVSYPVHRLAQTIENVKMGERHVQLTIGAGDTARNDLSILFMKDDTAITAGTPIEVPLNQSGQVQAVISVSDYDSTGVDAANYGEIYTRLVDGPPMVDSIDQAPSSGAGNNLFVIGDKPLTRTVTFKPVAEDKTCKELFGNTCEKITPQRLVGDTLVPADTSCGCADSCVPVNDERECDPLWRDNNLPRLDPCNGEPDKLVRKHSPFGTYTVRVYAANSGRRAPAQAVTSGPAVYDSLTFTVTPPRPVVHDIYPDRVLDDRVDHIYIAADELWNGDSVGLDPYVSVRWEADSGSSGTFDVYNLDIMPMSDTGYYAHSEMVEHGNGEHNTFRTPAAYEVKVPFHPGVIPDSLRDIGQEVSFKVALVNRDLTADGDTVKAAGNEMDIAFVYNTEEIECPNGPYETDSVNAAYVMDWIGLYPKNPSPGDTMLAYFTDLHDLDTASYTITLFPSEDTLLVDTLEVASIGDYGISFVLPRNITDTSVAFWSIRTQISLFSTATGCQGEKFTKEFRIIPRRTYDILPEADGFRIGLVGDTAGLSRYRNYDRIQYHTGIKPSRWSQSGGMQDYTHMSNPPQFVKLTHSDWITAVISDLDQINTYTITKWVEIADTPVLVNAAGDTMAHSFTVGVGDTLYISDPKPTALSNDAPDIIDRYRFDNGPAEKGRFIVFTSFRKNPLELSRTYAGIDTLGRHYERVTGNSSYTFTIEYPDTLEPIAVPWDRLNRTIGYPVAGYPLLLHLDTSNVRAWDLAETYGFHFRNRAMRPLAHEIEAVDWVEKTMTVWVNMDSLDPGLLNNTLWFVPGADRPENPRAVWSGYSAVWHGGGDTLFDASGNGNHIDGSGLIAPTTGLIGTADSMIGYTGISGAMPLKENTFGLNLSAWIRLDTLESIDPAGVPIVECVNGDTTIAAGLRVHHDGSLEMRVRKRTIRSISGVVEPGAWLHVGASVDNQVNNATAVVYVNGTAVARQQLNKAYVYADQDGYCVIGGDENGAFPGVIDEVRVGSRGKPGVRFALDYATQRSLRDFMTPLPGRTNVTAFSRHNISVSPSVSVNDPAYSDTDDWRIAGLPLRYRNRLRLSIPYGVRNNGDAGLATLKTNGAANIAVLHDAANINPPAFLDDFTGTDETAEMENAHGELFRFDIYRKQFDDSATISLDGPHTGMSNTLPYVVLISPEKKYGRVGVTTMAGRKGMHIDTELDSGALPWSDREYSITRMPQSLRGAVLLSPYNAFKHDSSDTAFAFTVDRPADVNLLVDTAYAVQPGFLNSWNESVDTVFTTNTALTVKRKRFDAGSYHIPGPRAAGGEGNRAAFSMIIDTAAAAAVKRADINVPAFCDTNWVINGISPSLIGKQMHCTHQRHSQSDVPDLYQIVLRRTTRVYICFPIQQLNPPVNIPGVQGSWRREDTLFISTDAPSLHHQIFSAVIPAGTLTLPGPHFGSQTGQADFTYIVMSEPFEADTGEILPDDSLYVVDTMTTEGDTLYSDDDITIRDLPAEIDGTISIETESSIDTCRYMVFSTNRPVLVYLALDPRFDRSGTFIEYDGWEKRPHPMITSDSIGSRILYRKRYEKGTVVISGIHCDKYQGAIFNYSVFLQYLNEPYKGYSGRNMAVRGVGARRGARSAGYVMKNLDIKYAYGLGLKSDSWYMNMTMHGGTQVPDDTTRVLSAFTDSIVWLDGADSTVTWVNDSFTLADLMPVMVSGDSVEVNAIDLRTMGAVRVRFTNRSDAAVHDPFDIVLFEDNDGDFAWDPNYDRYLGHASVNGIGAREDLLFEIELDSNLSYPEKTLFAFVDANLDIWEADEFNNVERSDGVCADYAPAPFVSDWDWTADSTLAAIIPADADPVVCRLKDTDGDSTITDADSLYLAYVSGYMLHAIDARTHDSLFAPFYVNGLDYTDMLVDDITGNGRAEIIVGSVVFDARGDTVWDATGTVPPAIDLDIDRDNVIDLVVWQAADSCMAIYSGRDTSLLFVYPLANWSDRQEQWTTGVLAHVENRGPLCFDLSASFPRFSVVSGDTAELTIRAANGGASPVDSGVRIRITHIGADSSETVLGTVTTTQTLPPDQYEDMSIIVPFTYATGSRLRFEISDRRIREMNMRNNRVELGL